MDESTSSVPRGALDGLRVIELGSLIAGPFATRLMAEFGADVIKIESPAQGDDPGGDPLRSWRKLHKGESLWWAAQARNKRCITVNLKHPEGRDIVLRLVERADVVVENMRPGALEKLGLGWEALRAVNPSLVMVRISGFGQSGPMRSQPGFGAIAEAMGGMRYVTGDPDRPPMRANLSLGDSIAALHAAFGALAALRHRDATGGRWNGHTGGEGQVVDVALTESVFNMLESTLMEYSYDGTVRQRTGTSIPGITPSNVYRSKGGEWVQISGNGDAIFRRLMLAIGRADMADDPGLARNPGRMARADEIDAAIQQWAATQQPDAIVQAMRAAEVPATRIYSIADVVADPQFQARGMIEAHTLADGTPVDLPAPAPRLSQTPGATRWLGPALGAHTDEVLAELGLDAAQIAALRESGAV
ncbi:CaiB/BaiF CoA transferase family protein [Thiomonas bhubaneswarensis]|uniref:Crotonobetainyl-CoA:carnitine CoA-transferase CaiB and related acyl-CoA transferases n=1 Tax=Thiomonas bhubaneswarensis TaxID=339866 RepID=A0A0K6I5I7_9BURK|nr:CaiB/BaiF CoA-transferase family protein [Thiomonas bhubaneswarensis]CUA98552.1 Crotonobetainyl-CoA:carnitine CoA-transferase CaiB and related acyl-CoA transferases [Thiomonas bhubaneswarensis]